MKAKKIIYSILPIIFLTFYLSCQAHAQDDVAEYSIALIPETSCIKKAQSLHKEIAKNLPRIKSLANISHVTLFQGAFTREDLSKIKNKLVKLDAKRFEIEFDGLKNTNDKWIDWVADKSKALRELHEQVVEIASPYYRRPINRFGSSYDILNAEEQKQVDEYGAKGVLDLYKPHMSLYYVHPENAALQKVPGAISDEKYEDVKCKVRKIVVGKIGYDGNMTRVAHTILLK